VLDRDDGARADDLSPLAGGPDDDPQRLDVIRCLNWQLDDVDAEIPGGGRDGEAALHPHAAHDRHERRCVEDLAELRVFDHSQAGPFI